MDNEQPHDPPVTLLLRRWQQGDSAAFDEVMRFVYADLRRRARAYLRRERDGHTLEPTGLVHEAFLKLVNKREIEWHDRDHFIAVAAQAMRRILVDHARTRTRAKRGGAREDLALDELPVEASAGAPVDLLALDEALERLASFDPRAAKIVELKYFGGMTLDETAAVLGVSEATVKREWQIARSWLRDQLKAHA